MPHCDSPLLFMNHSSLQMAHPSPGCSSCHSGLSKRFIKLFCFVFSCLYLVLLKVKTVTRWGMNHRPLLLLNVDGFFLYGCSWALTWFFFSFFFSLSLFSCHRRRKKRHRRNHLRRRKRRKKRTSNPQRMLPHSTYWLTVNQNWAVTPTPVPPHDHCSRQSPSAKRRVNTVHISCNSTG